VRIACVGGGPGGLYAAVRLKESDPARTVILFERNAPAETFGFGVVFSNPALENLQHLDLVLHRDVLTHAQRWDSIEVRLRKRAIRCRGQGFSAISRHTLLAQLAARAQAKGVDLRFNTEVRDFEELESFDLVVAADGAGSQLRSHYEKAFGVTLTSSATRYIWLGTRKRFDCLTFDFVRNEHGAFALHAYPFSPEGSTFLVETDEESWERARTGGASDATAPEYCRHLFADVLEGHRLVSNNSRWLAFRKVRAESWHHRNIVLLGDAAHTAHFSVGSGTTMALEDAYALAKAVDEHDEIRSACAAYQDARSPVIERLRVSAEASLRWWEMFGLHMSRELEQFAMHFLTRNRRVTRASLARRDPEFVSTADSRFLHSNGVMARSGPPSSAPLTIGSIALRHRRGCAIGESQPVDIASSAGGLVMIDEQRLDNFGDARGCVLACVVRRNRSPGMGLAVAHAAGVRWIDIESGPDDAVMRTAAIGANRSNFGVLSAHIWARDLLIPGQWGSRMERAGADALTIEAHDISELERLVLCVDTVRVQSKLPIILILPQVDDDFIETLIASGRVDVCVQRISAPRR
jgi:2-polyprenyl-6-methoxyphenol hydroxylase-like FAD-dependent oxidoreductase